MNRRENLIRAWRRQGPASIPIASGAPLPMWRAVDPAELEALMLKHPRLFPGYRKGDIDPDNFPLRPDLHAGVRYTDGWGSVWETKVTGMVGCVVEHPLADWSAFDGYTPPDPDSHDGMYPIDWDGIQAYRTHAREHGDPFEISLPHGHTFLRLQDLRGYENLIMDMLLEAERLPELITMVEAFNVRLIRNYIALGPDVIRIPEDLGMQNSPMLSPDQFRRYIKPGYRAMMEPIKAAGIIVHEHSDGYIMDLLDDIIDAGSEVINLQDLVNGVDAVAAATRGRISVDIDIDRQDVTVHGTPREIDDHIREIVTKLGGPEGGLSMVYQPWPPTPLRNIAVVWDAMEKYSTFHA